MKGRFTLLILFTVFLMSGCDGPWGGFGVSEGVIEYEAKPIDPNNPLATLAPSKMTAKFKGNKLAYIISAGMGFFNMVLISDPEERTVTQQVKLIGEKMVHVANEKEIMEEYASLPKFTLVESNETKMIAGYKCKKVTVNYENNVRPSFDIFYTKDIRVKDANWSTPYGEIKGVLMEYQVERFGLEMRFTAKSVTKDKVDNAIFETPKDYKPVPKARLDEIFDSFK